MHESSSRDLSFGLALLLRDDELVDLRLLNERIEHVEDAVRAPNLCLVRQPARDEPLGRTTYLTAIGQHD